MPPNPHATAVRAAQRTTDELRSLVGKLGTREHPRGRVLTAYRNARRALDGNLSDPLAVSDALTELLASVRAANREMLTLAVEAGLEQADREMQAYGIRGGAFPGAEAQLVSRALPAATGVTETQINAVNALALSGATDAGLILGGETRAGILSPAPAIRESAKWLTITAMSAWLLRSGEAARRSGVVFRRQAVAAIDERTTETCLRVHGQVVDMEEDFVLRGTPRFADELRAPPFHEYCRTSQVLVPAGQAGDDVTLEMLSAARAELSARDLTDVLQEIHPADAFSGR